MEQPDALAAGDARWRGRWLGLARTAWVAVLTLILGLFVAGIPVIAAELRTPCAGASCYRWQPTPQLAAEWAQVGLSLDFYAAFLIALEALFILGFSLIATIIVLRRSDEPIALFAAFMLVTFGPGSFVDVIRALGLSSPFWWWPRTFLACAGWAALFVFFYLFPNGRFVPRWTRLAAVGWFALQAFGHFSPPDWPISNQAAATATSAGATGAPLYSIGVLAFFASVVYAQVHRYRRVSSPAQRQQTKWVVCGFVAAFGGLALMVLVVGPFIAQAGSNSLVSHLVVLVSFYAILLLLPLSLAVAILRNRLWEIDLIINRTLVYGSLTTLLALLYFALIFASQALLQGIFQQNSDVAIVVSTLVIAALFHPLRQRIQQVIDRRFYHRKYDAARTLAAFSAALRDEVDLTQLSERLTAVVEETMQPTRVSLWLRPASQAKKPNTPT